MKIGQLAAAAGTQAETIRFYERKGLLPEAARTGSNYRDYDESHLHRLALIRHCRCLDMTLDEIRALLDYKDAPQDDCSAVDGLLDDHIGHVVARIGELKALEQELRTLKQQCAPGHRGSDCGILRGLDKAAREHNHEAPALGTDTHLRGTHRTGGARGAG